MSGSESNIRTKLEVRVDARQVGDLKRDVKAAFDPASARALTGETASLNKQLAITVRLTDKIGGSLSKIGDRAADSWGKVADQLERVTKAAGQAQTALAGVQNAGAGGGGGGGGVGAGGVNGRGGGGGMNLPQAPMPGLGALATALAAIPGVGLLAAGSMMAAGGAYSSHLRYQQAYSSAAPFIASPTAMLQLPGRSAALRSAAQGRATAAAQPDVNGAIADLWSAAAPASTSERMQARSLARGPMGDGGGAAWAGMSLVGTGDGHTMASDALDMAAAGAKDSKRAGALAKLQSIGEDIAAISGKGAAFREAAPDAGFRSVGIQYGVMPGDALGEAAGMSRASGGRTDARQYGFAKAVQALFGTGTEQTGALMGGLAHTGNAGSADEIADIIGSAMARGLEASSLNDYLQSMTGFLAQQAATGQATSFQGLLRSAEALQGSGMSGRRAGEVAQQFAGGAQSAGVNGGMDAATIHLMRAYGWTGRGGVEEYSRIRGKMQDTGNATPEVMSSYLNGMVGQGGGADSRTLIAQLAMSKIGANVGWGEAGGLANKGLGGAMMQPGFLTGGDITSAGLTASAGGRGSLIAEAGIESERIGIGAKAAKTMQALERTTNNMARIFEGTLGPAVQTFAEGLDSATDSIASFVTTFSPGKRAPQ